ncbi:MAG: SLBB domain-containing protein, partial [Desulfuromonadales bacterium]|nr:SLBB domain-containing protein [Desulfuromonadales bacterium]
QFRNAGTFYMDRSLTLLNGLALGGGMLDTANLRGARLIRDGQVIPVDIYQLLREGSLQQNVWLQAGDTIYVPDDKNQNVFVFGAVNNPGPVPMPNGRLSLSQALASSGFGETRGSAAYIRIIRSISTSRGELIVVDQKRIMRGEALPFFLTEGDIVYAPRSAIGNWNQAIQDLLPSLQTVSAILQPFVSVKYLRDND